MFGLGDDFEIDENFLDEVFEVEKACITNASKKNKNSTLNNINPNLEDTRLNIIPHQSTEPTLDTSLNFDSSRLNTPSFDQQICNVATPVLGARNSTHKECSSRKIRTRKFPGPAGLLPERQGNSSLIATEDFINEIEEELKEENKFKEEQVLSQDSARNLESPAWAELLKDLGENGKNLLRKLNVASVCNRAKQTRALKVPFLALLINNIDASTADPCLYLSDATGEMVGAVHREVWEQLSTDLVTGTVIVLINVGVLCAGHTTSRHYLNITSNNIAALYSPTKGSDIRVTNMKPLSQPDCSKFLQIWQEILSTPIQPITQQTIENRQLFSTVSLSSSPSLNLPQKRSGNNLSGGKFSKSFDHSFNRTPTLDSPIQFRSNMNDRYSLDSSPISRPNAQRFDPTNSTRSNYRSNNSNLLNNTQHIPSSINKITQFSSNSRLPRKTLSNHSFDNNFPQSTVSNNSRSDNYFAPKRPRFDKDVSNSQKIFSSVLNTQVSAASQSIVESELDGIDTESLFGDF